MVELSPRQRDVLVFIKQHAAVEGYPPTVREIGVQLGLKSNNGVYDHLKALRKKGFLSWIPMRTRTFRLTAAGKEALALEEEGGRALKVEQTLRGSNRSEFVDNNDELCSIQKSSSALEDKIWLGINEVVPKYMPGNGTGWHDVPLDGYPSVLCAGRMHLTQEQVSKLLPSLQHFVETGDLLDEEVADGA